MRVSGYCCARLRWGRGTFSEGDVATPVILAILASIRQVFPLAGFRGEGARSGQRSHMGYPDVRCSAGRCEAE
ncbi:hypothetical protein E2C01_089913 [Portunus trituberculatus]|uniref:Uncharacterized protein n=1 Tax=Portunus trituberculatus TaxID=210409 RepID=A0A5B7JA37_PORTR|nr:hypothetical protein [Portunus trituberculatus]